MANTSIAITKHKHNTGPKHNNNTHAGQDQKTNHIHNQTTCNNSEDRVAKKVNAMHNNHTETSDTNTTHHQHNLDSTGNGHNRIA